MGQKRTRTRAETHNFPGLSQEAEGHQSSLYLGSISLFAPSAPEKCLSNEARAEARIRCSGVMLVGGCWMDHPSIAA